MKLSCYIDLLVDITEAVWAETKQVIFVYAQYARLFI